MKARIALSICLLISLVMLWFERDSYVRTVVVSFGSGGIFVTIVGSWALETGIFQADSNKEVSE